VNGRKTPLSSHVPNLLVRGNTGMIVLRILQVLSPIRCIVVRNYERAKVKPSNLRQHFHGKSRPCSVTVDLERRRWVSRLLSCFGSRRLQGRQCESHIIVTAKVQLPGDLQIDDSPHVDVLLLTCMYYTKNITACFSA
jgi:hypothetical protein